MNTKVLNYLNEKYKTKFKLLQSRGFNQVYASDDYILNIYPKGYDLNSYKEKYNFFSNIHKNIPEINEWNEVENFYIQNKIQKVQENWTSKDNISDFFDKYLELTLEYRTAKMTDLYTYLIKKIYSIYSQIQNTQYKVFFANFIKELKENKNIFSGEMIYPIHGDLSDTNILVSGEDFYIIDLENVSYFDYYYDLVSFDFFVGQENIKVYENILKQNNKIFSIQRYKLMKKLFNFIQKNNLGNLI